MSLLFKHKLKYFIYVILAVALVTVGFVTYLVWLQPPFNFPKPTGHYAVGTKLYHWIDTQRKDIHSNNPAHPYQELMVKIWFPAKGISPEKPTTPYAPDLFAHIKKTKPLAALLSGASRQLYVYETSDATLSPDIRTWPVIIFSPGQGGRYDSNSAHCQELASYGYIVVGISHPYDSTLIQFPDGRIKTPSDNTSGKSFIETRKLTDQKIIEERIADVRFVLDQLEALTHNKKSMFYDRLDLEHMGIFGQSLGGSTAVALCRRDPRIKAGVDLDGSLFGIDAIKSFDKPFMFIVAGESLNIVEGPLNKHKQKAFNVHTPQEDMMLKDRYLAGFQKIATDKSDKYIFVATGAGHIDFTNNALLLKYAAPIVSRPLIKRVFVGRLGYGSIDGIYVTKIVNTYLVNFFDKYLKGKSSALLDSKTKPYAEVEQKQ